MGKGVILRGKEQENIYPVTSSDLVYDPINKRKINEQINEIVSSVENKVDKEEGKKLSSNDYTNTDKNKLDGIESGAQVNSVIGVKGDSESSYRKGNINITKSNIGLGNVDNTPDSEKSVNHANTANEALKSESDGNGNNIVNTYSTKEVVNVIKERVTALSQIQTNFIGYFDNASILPTPSENSWALVGDLSASVVYAYYISSNIPTGYSEGWNPLNTLGTYDLTDYDNVKSKIFDLNSILGYPISQEKGSISGLASGTINYLEMDNRVRVTFAAKDIESLSIIDENYKISAYAIYQDSIPTTKYFGSSSGVVELDVQSLVSSNTSFIPSRLVVVIARVDNAEFAADSNIIGEILRIKYTSSDNISEKINRIKKQQNIRAVGAIYFPSNDAVRIDSLSIYCNPDTEQESFTHSSLLTTHQLDTGGGSGILVLHNDGTAGVVTYVSDVLPTDIILLRYLKSRGGICGGILYENYIASMALEAKNRNEYTIEALGLIDSDEILYDKIVNADTGEIVDSSYSGVSMIKKYIVNPSEKYLVTGRVGIGGTNTAIVCYYDINNVYLGCKYRGEGKEIILENETLDIIDGCNYIYVLGTHPDFSTQVEPKVLLKDGVESRISALEGLHKDSVEYTIERGSATGLASGTLSLKDLTNRYRFIGNGIDKIKRISVTDKDLYKISLSAVFKGEIPTSEYYGQAISSTVVTDVDIQDYISKSANFIPDSVIVVVGRQDDAEFSIESWKEILSIEYLETNTTVKPLDGRTVVVLGDSSCDATNWNVWSRILISNKAQLGCTVLCPALRSSGWSELEKEPFNVQAQWDSIKGSIEGILDPIIIITTGGNELDQLLLNYEDGLDLCNSDTSNLNNPQEWAVQTLKNICEDKPGACIYLVSNFYATAPTKNENRRLYREFLTAMCDYFSCTLIDLTRNSQIRGYLESDADSNGYHLFTQDGVHAATSLGKNRIYKKIMSQVLLWESII